MVNGNVTSFKGIPFASPPVGELRWKAPQPVKAWNGVKKVDAFGPGCMQDARVATMLGGPQNFSEDCLYQMPGKAKEPGSRALVQVLFVRT